MGWPCYVPLIMLCALNKSYGTSGYKKTNATKIVLYKKGIIISFNKNCGIRKISII